jgi:hypothetical protein
MKPNVGITATGIAEIKQRRWQTWAFYHLSLIWLLS